MKLNNFKPVIIFAAISPNTLQNKPRSHNNCRPVQKDVLSTIFGDVYRPFGTQEQETLIMMMYLGVALVRATHFHICIYPNNENNTMEQMNE